MKPFNDNELRELLLLYEVSGPSPELVSGTIHLMRAELAQHAAEPLKPEKWVFMLVGLAVVMSLCLFYILTVGTILQFILPSYLLEFLEYSLYVFTAAGGSILACALMVLCFKKMYPQVRRATV